MPPRKTAPPKTQSDFAADYSQKARIGEETSGNHVDNMNAIGAGYDPQTGKSTAPIVTEGSGRVLDVCISAQHAVTLPGGKHVVVEPDPDNSTEAIVTQKPQTKSQIRRQIGQALRQQREGIPEGVIAQTRITVMSYEEAKNRAVALITIPSAEIKRGTVNDPRMGVEKDGVCATCYKDLANCPTHDGFIDFARMMHHPLFMEETIFALQWIALGCGKLRLNDFQLQEAGLNRMFGINKLRLGAELSVKTGFCPCPACSSKNEVVFDLPKSKEQKVVVFRMNKKATATHVLGVEQVYNIFKSISPADAAKMGFVEGATPERFIMRGIPVIGPGARPPTIENGERRSEHLTSMYIDIVKLNNALAEPGLSEVRRNELYEQFTFTVAHFINNSDGKYTPSGHGQPYKSIQQRLQGKTELRGHAMGKRVNYSARTVISPDLTLAFNEVSVPEEFCSVLTYPIRVCVYNVDYIRRLWKEGKVTHITSQADDHPFKDIKREVNKRMREKEIPQIGDEVERWLQEGDWVFNDRQPTLHSIGFRAFKVKVRKAKTIGVNLVDTKAFNADFDGDEMNLHIPRSVQALAEAINIASAQACIMNGQNDTPSVGFKLDVVSALYEMTLENRPVDRHLFFDAYSFLTATPAIDLVDHEARARKYGMELFTTKVMVSLLFPRDFWYKHGKVEIKEGILVTGPLTDDHVGPVSRSITQFLYMRPEYGPERTSQWLTDGSTLALTWATAASRLTFGLQQCMPKDRAAHQGAVRSILTESKLQIAALGPAPDATADPLGAERHEAQIRGYINIAGKIGDAVAEHYDPSNPLFIMTKSKAKGKASNVAQITSMIGQQFLRGNRLRPKLPGGRTLSYYTDDDASLEANGFISSSFLQGLSGPEFFMLMMAGREGLVDTANTTSIVGATNHKLVKALENLVVNEHGACVDANGTIISAIYGGDGLSGGSLVRTKIGDETIATFIDMEDMARALNGRASVTLSA